MECNQYYDHMIEELKNTDHNMFEQATLMRNICKEYNMTQSALAKQLKVSQSSIGNKIRLLQYNLQERDAILRYRLSERHARALLRILPPKRAKLIETVGRMQLTVQQTEELTEKYGDNNNFAATYDSNTLDNSSPLETFLQHTQSGAEQLRLAGNKVTCLTERGESWHRITVTISE